MVATRDALPGVGHGGARARWAPSQWPKRVFVVVLVAAAAVGIGAVTIRTVFDTYGIEHDEMAPTLRAGDHALSRPTINASHGDIVVFVVPLSGQTSVGRVVAVGGDTIATRDDVLLINGVEVVESYLEPGTATAGIDQWTIPAQHFYVLGDNRELAIDSRRFGAVRGDALIARVVARSWPPSRIGGV